MPTLRKPSTKILSGEDVKTWRFSRNLTQAECGEWLGLTPQAFHKYEMRGASKTVALAMSALDRGLKPYKPSEDDIRIAEEQRQKNNGKRKSG